MEKVSHSTCELSVVDDTLLTSALMWWQSAR